METGQFFPCFIGVKTEKTEKTVNLNAKKKKNKKSLAVWLICIFCPQAKKLLCYVSNTSSLFVENKSKGKTNEEVYSNCQASSDKK